MQVEASLTRSCILPFFPVAVGFEMTSGRRIASQSFDGHKIVSNNLELSWVIQ